jgi:hypothetical protein
VLLKDYFVMGLEANAVELLRSGNRGRIKGLERVIVKDRQGCAGSNNRTSSIGLIIGFSRRGLRFIKAPPGQQRLVNLLWSAELEVAGLLGDDGALMFGLEPGNQLSLEPAGLLGVQVTDLLRNIKERHNSLVMALLGSFLRCAPSTTYLNRELLASSVSNKLARLLLNVLGGARRFIDGSALLRTLSIADLFNGLVALLNGLVESLLFEGNLTDLLKVLLTHFFLGSFKQGHIGVMALLNILVCALENWILLNGLDGLLLLNAAKAGIRVILAATEINSTWNATIASLPSRPQSSVGQR